MEPILAKKLSEMEFQELLELLTRLKMQDLDAFRTLRDLIEEL